MGDLIYINKYFKIYVIFSWLNPIILNIRDGKNKIINIEILKVMFLIKHDKSK